MLQTRIFPCLLINGEGLVKTVQFRNPTYIGDPINAVRIFNSKEVDELLLLDITATQDGRKPNLELIKKISDECAMPLTVGGGIAKVDDIGELLNSGVEKVAINTAAINNLGLITNAASSFGCQAIVGAMDVKKTFTGKHLVFTSRGRKSIKISPVKYAKILEDAGVGEILLYSIDRDGMMKGFDLDLINSVSNVVNIPVIACGGAGRIEHIAEAVEHGASAVTAGSMFVFHGKRRAVLINFPEREELEGQLFVN